MNAFAWPCDCEGPNPSSKSSSNVTVANFPSLASPVSGFLASISGGGVSRFFNLVFDYYCGSME